MTDKPPDRQAPTEPGVLMYQLVCLVGLGLILGPQLQRGVGLPELFLAVVGLLGLVTCWRLAPFAVLAIVAVSQATRPYLWGISGLSGYRRTLEATDLLLCCGVLAYVAAHYRLRGLLSHVLPPDPRLRPGERRQGLLGRWRRKPVRYARPPHQVTPRELALFILGLPLWAVLAQLVWAWVAHNDSFLGRAPALARFILLAWAVGAAGMVAGALLAQWRRRTMTPAEAELLLQDVLWRETRREQRRLQRWLAWSRLRRARRKETP
jgi:hypothetical protein